MKATMIIGPSGTGKTTLAGLISEKNQPCYIVNESNTEHPDVMAQPLAFENVLTTLRWGSTVIFDDLILPDNKQIKIMKNLLLFEKRHKNISVLVLVHSTTSNKTYSLLRHFDEFVFTKSTQNHVNYTEVCSKFFKQTQADRQAVWETFMNHKDPHAYLKMDAKDGSSRVFTLNEDPLTLEMDQKRRKVLNLLKAMGDPTRGMALFDHIFANISISELDGKDLSIKMAKKGDAGSGVISVNICDLLIFATDPDSNPTEECVRLFKLFMAKFSIPKALVRNTTFLK